MKALRSMYLGGVVSPAGGPTSPLQLPPHHLVTHGVVLGMTGSGKTGLLMVMVEEALQSGVPVLMIDVKGDLPNLLLSFPSFGAEEFVPWVEGFGTASEAEVAAQAAELASERQKQLASWNVSLEDVAAFRAGTALRVLTPGSSAGEPVHILSSLERRPASWDADPEAGRAALSAAISLVLRLLGKDPDPSKSREHVLLSVLAERRLEQGQSAELAALIADVLEPPLERIGALSNADFWAVGRLQTDADRARVVDSLANASEPNSAPAELNNVLRKLGPRWFPVRDVHSDSRAQLLKPRWGDELSAGADVAE